MLHEGEESWTAFVQSTANLSPLGLFLGKVSTGRMRYIGWMDVLVRILFISEKVPWTLEKSKSRQQKNNEQHR